MSSTVDGGDISVDGVDADPLEIDSPDPTKVGSTLVGGGGG